MRKALFNITRPYWEGDEVANLWLGEGDDWTDASWEDSEDGVTKFLHREVGDCCVLVADPSLLDDVERDDAALEEKVVESNGEGKSSVQEVIESATSGDCLIAVLYHDTDSEHTSREKRTRLVMPEADFHFIDNYSSQNRGDYDRFYKSLAEADKENFEEQFEKLWDHYAPDEDLEAKLDLLHKLLTEEGANNVDLDEEVPAAYREQVEALQEDYSHEKLETLRDRMLDAP